MQLCAVYSSSHKRFFDDFFIKTLPHDPNLKLYVERMDQACSSGYLFSDGWRAQMIKKQIFINKCLNIFDDDLCLFSDVDVAFYSSGTPPLVWDLEKCLGNNDIAFMKDHGHASDGRSAGFFVVKPNDKIKAFFAGVLRKLRYYEEKGGGVAFKNSEQGTINQELEKYSDIKWDFLPERYYTHGKYINGLKNKELPYGKWWDQKSKEEREGTFIPPNISVHHANWCCGKDNKIDLLNFVRSKVQERNEKKQTK